MADSSALADMMEKLQSMSPSMAERNAAETEQAQQQTRLAKARFELSPSLRRAERRLSQREKEKELSNSRQLGMSWGDRPSLGSMVDSQQDRVKKAQAKREEAQQARAARSLSYQQIKQPASAPTPASAGMNEPSVTQAPVNYVDPSGRMTGRNANIVTGQYGTAVGGAPVAGSGGSGRTIGNDYYGNSREALLAGANKIAQSRAPQPPPRMTVQSAVQPKKNPLMPN